LEHFLQDWDSVLSNTSLTIIGITTSSAAGAILAMLAESMMPEAFEQGGSKIGLATVVGFATAFTLGTLG
jgi:zinc transporter, ZIP family